MIIEILNDQGAVITKVANSSDPDADVALYGGAAWRPFVKSEDELTSDARREKIREIIEYRKETLIAAVDDAHTLIEALYLLWEVFTASGATLDPKWQLAWDIWDHAKLKINQMNALPRDQVEAYDPASDPSWPT